MNAVLNADERRKSNRDESILRANADACKAVEMCVLMMVEYERWWWQKGSAYLSAYK